MDVSQIVIYSIPAPYSGGEVFVQVYGDPHMGAYEWRICGYGNTVTDTKNRGYGSAEIALRDGLVFASEIG